MTRAVAIAVVQEFHCPNRPVTPWSNCHMAFSKKPLNMMGYGAEAMRVMNWKRGLHLVCTLKWSNRYF